MKKLVLKVFVVIVFSFFGGITFSQNSVNNTAVEAISFQTKIVEGHEIMIFNSIEDKEEWIRLNPETYLIKVEEANSVSATFIGTLLQVMPKKVEENLNNQTK